MQELYEDVYQTWFSFGKNWEQFLSHITPEQVELAKKYVQDFLWTYGDMSGKTVIDIWCWSGLMSLVYILLWAKKVVSIDIDTTSIACAEYLRKKQNISPEKWEIKLCSILDEESIKDLWTFDMVYSRWVIHHSGDMRKWLTNLFSLTHESSMLYIALYNTCTRWVEWTSSFWATVKKIYSKQKRTRYIIKPIYTCYLLIWLVVTWRNPIQYIRTYKSFRGMDFFTDIEDRLWWYPYEHASYSEITNYYVKKWYKLINWIQVRSIWCNEYLLKK